MSNVYDHASIPISEIFSYLRNIGIDQERSQSSFKVHPRENYERGKNEFLDLILPLRSIYVQLWGFCECKNIDWICNVHSFQ